MKKFKMSITFLTMVLPALFISCDKDPLEQYPDDTNGKPPVAKQLIVVLDEEYMPTAKVDSAIAIWEVNGTSKTVKLQLQGNQLVSSLSDFQQSGTGTLTVQLFTQVQADGRPLQWETRLPYTLNRNSDKVLDGPAGIKDPAWNPRVIFKYGVTANERFTFIVAIRPDDPYLELIGVKPQYASRIDIFRGFYKNEPLSLVTSRNWTCSAACLDSKGNLLNKEFFLGLPAQLNGKQWDHFRITAHFYITNNPNKIYEFFDFNLDAQ